MNKTKIRPANGSNAMTTGATLAAKAALLGLLMAPSAPALAQSISFTNHCENSTSEAERANIEQAYGYVWDARHELFEEIERDRSGPDEFGYAHVDEDTKDDWLAEIGTIKVNCETAVCRNNDGSEAADGDWQFGRAKFLNNDFIIPDLGNRIIVCYDNIANYCMANGCDRTLAIAQNIAHEVAHRVDGATRHSDDDAPWNPIDVATTIGVALEHYFLTPDLSASVVDREVSASGENYEVRFDVEVENLNPLSGDVSHLRAMSGHMLGYQSTTLALAIDGEQADIAALGAIDGGSTRSRTLTATVDAFDESERDGVHAWLVEADSNDLLRERKEDNNEVEGSLDLRTDLAITRVELASPYEEHMEFRAPGGMTHAVYSWRTLTYMVEIENVHPSLPSRPTDLSMIYDDMWTASDEPGVIERMSPALDPGETRQYYFSVDVRMGLVSVHPTEVTFRIDAGEPSTNDRDWSNNEVTLLIDDDYFAPDYRVEIESLSFEDSVSVSTLARVRNLGPEPAGRSSAVRLSINGDVVDTTWIAALGSTADTTVVLEDDDYLRAATEDYEFLIEVDATDVVDESVEDNNAALAVLRHVVDEVDITSLPDLDLDITGPVHVDLEEGLDIDLVDGSWMPSYDVLDMIGNGPVLPDVWYHDYSASVILLYQSAPPALAISIQNW